MKLGEEKDLSLSEIASLAGFHIPSDRVKVFISQFEWIMNKAIIFDAVNLNCIEPANIFSPQTWLNLTGCDDDESK